MNLGVQEKQEDDIFWHTPQGYASVTPSNNGKTVILENGPLNPNNYKADFCAPYDYTDHFNVTLL